MLPKVPVGFGTILGALIAVLSGAGMIVAAIKANDTATVEAGAMTITAGLATIGGRVKQAIELTRRYAPIIEAGAKGIGATPPAVATPSDAGLGGVPLSDTPIAPDEQ